MKQLRRNVGAGAELHDFTAEYQGLLKLLQLQKMALKNKFISVEPGLPKQPIFEISGSGSSSR